ncbi:MAG: protein kinase [Polyangiaceae bacterium]|nr:protein kinase [Polyangiaceae bacterium]
MTEDVFGIVGTVVAGAYKVEAVVAEGGFGVVYRAYHSGFRAPVAVKCLKVPQQLSQEQEEHFLEQFRAEAELLFRLSASIPTVVRPLHVDAITLPDGRFVPFMALEWLEGETLDAIAQRRRAEGLPPLPLKKLVRMLTPVARALEKAHNFQGPSGPVSIVHRDLKPENIFVANIAGEEQVKILDFGIGKAKSMASQVAGRASQTESAFSSFTPAYGAPEQWVPKRFGQTGPWTDVWGLALTIVEVMAGRTIIDGDHAGMMGTTLDPTRRPTPRNEGLDVPDAVERVFARALALDPRERHPDAGAFWSDLTQALGMRQELREPMSSRDSRADGVAPRVETIEAATSPRHRVASGARKVSFTGVPAQAAAAAGLYAPADAVPQSGAPVSGQSAVPDLDFGSIPDLAGAAPSPQARPKAAKKSERPPAYARAMDFDDSPSQVSTLGLEVDLPEGERPSLRSPGLGSGANWPAVTEVGSAGGAGGSRPNWPMPDMGGPHDVDARRRISSATMPAATGAPRTASGAHAIATGSVPPASAAQSVRSMPPSAAPMASIRPGAGASMYPGPGTALPPLPPLPPEQTVVRRVLPGAILVLVSIIVTLADQWYAASSGELFTLGPVRATWIAGVAMLGGVVLIAVRLIPSSRS